MSDAEAANAATRILKIINRVQSVDENVRAETAWAYGFALQNDRKKPGELTSHERAELMRKLGHFQLEIDELEQAILASIPLEQQKLYTRHIPALRSFAAIIALNVEWKNHQPKLPEAAHQFLELLSYHLPKELVVPAEEISELKNELSRLITSVKSQEGLDPDFRRWLLHVLVDIEHKLDLYEIYGGRIFRRIYMEAFGEFATHHEVVTVEVNKNGETQTTVQRIFALWHRCGEYMQRASVPIMQGLRLAKLGMLLSETPTDDAATALEHLTGTVLKEMKE